MQGKITDRAASKLATFISTLAKATPEDIRIWAAKLGDRELHYLESHAENEPVDAVGHLTNYLTYYARECDKSLGRGR